jgi:DNA-binding response OmpR family regulator
MKILLVDDDAFLRDMYATKFTQKGYEVDVAETAEVALSKLHDHTYDIALLDIIMPGMNGLELLRKIKSEQLASNPICIMLSNQSEETDKKEAFDGGAKGYIVKAEHIPSEVVDEVARIAGGQ